ncbi:MAG: metallophosphoesterase [Eubacterium sp.]|nr:metallophosphoesterase [Eubacterium sp.]
MNIFIKWILLFIAAEAVLSALQFILRKREVKPAVRVVLIIAKALVAIAAAVIVLAGPVQLRPAQPFLIALYAALLPDALGDAVYSIICKIRKSDRKFSAYKAISLLLGILFFIFGTVNMENVTPKYHTYESSKITSAAGHKIIFAADIHIGSAQPFSVLEKEVADMAEEKPEAIILGGDITDDYTTKAEMEQAFKLFGDCGVPVYYLYGNHDRQKHAEYANGMQFTAEELETALKENGITVLKDEYVSLSDDLLLLGREDISEGEARKDIKELSNPSPEKFLIIADHQPVGFKENSVAGCDLQLSGHTHAGQLFPLGLLYKVIGYSYGEFAYRESKMLVSSGACGWRVPFRTSAGCNYEVITLKAPGDKG